MPAELTCVAAPGGQGLRALAGFFAGYAVVLATPGPNLLGVGGIAALRGLRGAWPLCLGIALGACGLNAALLLLAFGLAADGAGWDRIGRAIGALFLLHVAASVARLRPPVEEVEAPAARRRDGWAAEDAAAMGAGLLVAATNPLTGTFFATWHLGCVGTAPDPTAFGLAVLGVFAVAFGFFLGVAALLAHPFARHAALAWHRPIRLGAAAALLLMSAAAFRAALG